VSTIESPQAQRERIRKGLLALVDTTLTHPDAGKKVSTIMNACGANVNALKKEVLAYSLDRDEKGYENTRYQQLLARLTLYFHNHVPGTYHIPRQNAVRSFLEQLNPQQIMDVGYGTPAPYLIDYLNNNASARALLLDQDATAEEFAKIVLQAEAPSLVERVDFQAHDMNSETYPGDAEAYLYLDSMEHTKQPTEYLRMLVDNSKIGSHYIFSIPICSMKGLENFHFAEWLNDDAARAWVKDAGLQIVNETTVHPNPAVDFFAEFCEGGFHNYIVMSKK
jgi:hypothetical protein